MLEQSAKSFGSIVVRVVRVLNALLNAIKKQMVACVNEINKRSALISDKTKYSIFPKHIICHLTLQSCINYSYPWLFSLPYLVIMHRILQQKQQKMQALRQPQPNLIHGIAKMKKNI